MLIKRHFHSDFKQNLGPSLIWCERGQGKARGPPIANYFPMAGQIFFYCSKIKLAQFKIRHILQKNQPDFNHYKIFQE